MMQPTSRFKRLKLWHICMFLLASLTVISGCAGEQNLAPTPVVTPLPTSDSSPTATAEPSATPEPTSTPTPTNEPAAEVTPDPTVYFPTAEEIEEMQQLARYLIDSIPQPIAAPTGWTIRPCEGSAPIICLETETGETGAVELGAYPLRTYPDLHPTLAQHGLPLGEIDTGSQSYREGAPYILEVVAAEALSTLAADRTIGRPQWQFAPLETKPIAFGGLPGLQYGFTMADHEGVVRERVLSHVTFDESHIYFIGAAYDPEAVWSVASDDMLLTVEPYLRDIIAKLPLPKDSD